MKHFEAVSFLTTLVAMLCLVTQPCSARGKDSKWNIVLHPAKRSIVLVGDGTNIRVHCEPGLTHDISLNIEANNPDTVRVLTPQLNISVSGNPGTENSNDSDSDMKNGPVCGHIRILGIKPGSVGLKIVILHSNGSLAARPIEDYVVTVVRRVDVLQDAFMYVLSTAQVMVLLMLGWRLRSAAVKEVLCRPCTLIGAILCQTLLMPLVTLGVSIALSLPVHSVVSLLIVGCCPAGVLSPVFAVLQQAHVELAVVLLLIETAAAFGAMPLWLFTYGHFLGLAYSNVTFPFLHIAGALLAVAGPITLGISLQRCTPRHLPGIDKAVQPTSLLLVLVASTVRLHATWRHWELATWRLVLGCALVPVGGALMGSVATAIFRQKLPQVKTVAIVTSLQNTLLATVILQTSFPAPDASLMAVTITCLDVTSLALMILLYVIHVGVWLSWPFYRSRHDSIGISGAYRSIGERIVKSMIKAGEITLLRASGSPSASKSSKDSSNQSRSSSSSANAIRSSLGHIPILVPGRDGFRFGTIGLRRPSFSSSLDTICKSRDSLVPLSSSGDLSLRYFASSTNSSPKSQARGSEQDSLSIDYSMLIDASTQQQAQPAQLQQPISTEPKTNDNQIDESDAKVKADEKMDSDTGEQQQQRQQQQQQQQQQQPQQTENSVSSE